MKNGSGAPVPTEQEAIRNIEKQNKQHIEQVFDNIEETLRLMGYSLLSIHIKDRKSKEKHRRDRGK